MRRDTERVDDPFAGVAVAEGVGDMRHPAIRGVVFQQAASFANDPRLVGADQKRTPRLDISALIDEALHGVSPDGTLHFRIIAK